MARWASPPARDLRDTVALYWYVEDRPSETLLLPPEVSVDLVFEAEPPTTFRAADGTTTTVRGPYLSGTRTRFHRVDQHGAFRILAARLQPWVLATHVGLDAGAFVNRFVVPPAALADLATALKMQSAAAGGDEPPVGVVAALDAAARACLAAAAGAAAATDQAARTRLTARAERLWRAIDLDPTTSVRALADDLGVSVATLERVSRAAFGMRPKEALRIVRHNRTWEALNAPDAVSWARVSAAVGYADQSHFIREFSAFTGMTPARYLRERSSVADRYRQR